MRRRYQTLMPLAIGGLLDWELTADRSYTPFEGCCKACALRNCMLGRSSM